jgi:hypothetical protein
MVKLLCHTNQFSHLNLAQQLEIPFLGGRGGEKGNTAPLSYIVVNLSVLSSKLLCSCIGNDCLIFVMVLSL